MQIQADLIRTNVDRPVCVETTALGAAYLAGLATGIYGSLDEIRQNRVSDKVFIPQMDEAVRNSLYDGWKKAVSRSMKWEE